MTENYQIKLDDKIEEALLEKRRLFISDAVDNESTKQFIRKLWYLDFQDPKKPITIVINSPGGSVDHGFAIWDQIKMMKAPIATVVTGLAASMGSVLSLCASPKKRFATPNARFMIHQPLISGVIQGQASDLSIHGEEILKTRERLAKLYSEFTGKSVKDILKALDRDTWMSAEEAKKFGLIDDIIDSFDKI